MENEKIVKALGLCFNINHNAGFNCCECPYRSSNQCSFDLYNDTVDLINSQRAEIDRLTDRNKRLGEGVDWLLNNENGIELIRAEAIKEFAEKLITNIKEHYKRTAHGYSIAGWNYSVSDIEAFVDNLVKEMGGTE